MELIIDYQLFLYYKMFVQREEIFYLFFPIDLFIKDLIIYQLFSDETLKSSIKAGRRVPNEWRGIP